MSRTLNARQLRFVDEYLVDLNASQAAARAGYSAKTARTMASLMLSDPDIIAAVRQRMDERAQRTFITQDLVLRQWFALATADVNEIMEFRRNCCRHCWGAGFAYQWTASEWAAKLAGKEAKPPAGGVDFDSRKPPNAKCPECNGEGVGTPFYKDTRNLSPGARALYAGVKVTKEGIEVKTNSQEKAWEMIMRHLGGVVEKHKHEHSGPNGAPIQSTHVTTDEFREIARELLRDV
jgi:phage terminase small subunit